MKTIKNNVFIILAVVLAIIGVSNSKNGRLIMVLDKGTDKVGKIRYTVIDEETKEVFTVELEQNLKEKSIYYYNSTLNRIFLNNKNN